MDIKSLPNDTLKTLLDRAKSRAANTVYLFDNWSRNSRITWKLYSEWSRRQ